MFNFFTSIVNTAQRHSISFTALAFYMFLPTAKAACLNPLYWACVGVCLATYPLHREADLLHGCIEGCDNVFC